MGIGVIDVDNHECMTLGSIQTPDCKTLDNFRVWINPDPQVIDKLFKELILFTARAA